MTRIEFHNKAHYILAILIAFTLPFGKFTPILIGLLLINWLTEGDFPTKLKTVFNNKFARVFILFYIIHIIGLLYTNNMSSGLFDLEVKLSILIFPLVISSKPFSKREISNIFLALIIGLLYAAVYMLSRSVSLYFMNNENTFFYKNFSVLIHSSYLAMYYNVAIVWLIINIFQKDIETKYFSNFISMLLITAFSIVIILLAAKSGIVSLVLIYFVIIFYLLFFKKKYVVGFVGIIFIVFSLFLVNLFAPKVITRIDSFVDAITTKSKNETTESTSVRLLIWESSNQVIKNNFILGVGTGDSKDMLVKEYEKQNITNALENKFNSHNEFYQVFVTLGVVGFILLCIIIFFPLIDAFRTNNYLYAAFLLIIIFNFISESMLETQAGVMFYAFFNSILCFRTSE